MHHQNFAGRHIGPDPAETSNMLSQLDVRTLDQLIAEVVPQRIRREWDATLPAMSEPEYLAHIRQLAQKNTVAHNFIGQGYYGTHTPSPILRNIFENPGWYTAYTPYQAEIAQGRMEAILNFQTMVMELTGMELANASLLDEGTAAAEAMAMTFGLRSKEAVQRGANKFFVSRHVFDQTLDVLQTRSEPLGIVLEVGDVYAFEPNDQYFGALLQYPDATGGVHAYADWVAACHDKDIKVVVATDLLSLTLLTPPGEWGADVVVGNSQRLGVPMGYGGPHAAFFATNKTYQRSIPGRIIGATIDAQGKPALRMALQTREQHIRRDKATSNICTAQALLAIMAGMYAVYHGPEGLQHIASNVHKKAVVLADALNQLGFQVTEQGFFDTLEVQLPAVLDVSRVKAAFESAHINVFYAKDGHLRMSVDETTSAEQLSALTQTLAGLMNRPGLVLKDALIAEAMPELPAGLRRTSPYLTHPVFHLHRSETALMRYIKKLESKDIALNFSMIALGSCTMKLNAASELMPLSWPEFNALHPFAPVHQAEGYQQMLRELSDYLAYSTGFDAVSLQPNSGAQGEYAGLMVIRAYHHARGDAHRDVVLIPQSAHGTNPASAVMAGMKVVVIKCDAEGNIDVADLRAQAEAHADKLSALMVTYPSTHGVFEEQIQEITAIIHNFGGQVYMDGANMNAQVGLTSPAHIGADVCHLNLHKTFAIPHGGGGPGMGPIGVKAHLAPFLPGHPVVATGGDQAIPAISAAPWGSPLILLISYAYIKMLGYDGLKASTEFAILNANYMKNRLQEHYPVLYSGNHGRVAHEFILDCREFKKVGIEVVDIAKRLMDYGFHAPTVSFPVAGTLMIEPTESENKAELDRFCDALIAIREEIREVEIGVYDVKDNVLKHAPHTAEVLLQDAWTRPYSRQKAAYPLSYLVTNKFFPSVSRVDDAYGDRNLVCSCLPMEAYA
jgi:glycine dehydrogenase